MVLLFIASVGLVFLSVPAFAQNVEKDIYLFPPGGQLYIVPADLVFSEVVIVDGRMPARIPEDTSDYVVYHISAEHPGFKQMSGHEEWGDSVWVFRSDITSFERKVYAKIASIEKFAKISAFPFVKVPIYINGAYYSPAAKSIDGHVILEHAQLYYFEADEQHPFGWVDIVF